MGIVESVVYFKAFTCDELTLKHPAEVSLSPKSWRLNLAVWRLRQDSAINGQTQKLQGQVNYDVSPGHLPYGKLVKLSSSSPPPQLHPQRHPLSLVTQSKNIQHRQSTIFIQHALC